MGEPIPCVVIKIYQFLPINSKRSIHVYETTGCGLEPKYFTFLLEISTLRNILLTLVFFKNFFVQFLQITIKG
jgi:hypothetical protein